MDFVYKKPGQPFIHFQVYVLDNAEPYRLHRVALLLPVIKSFLPFLNLRLGIMSVAILLFWSYCIRTRGRSRGGSTSPPMSVYLQLLGFNKFNTI